MEKKGPQLEKNNGKISLVKSKQGVKVIAHSLKSYYEG